MDDVSFAVVSPGSPGDYNQNGTIDAADYVLLRKSAGAEGLDLAVDGNGDDIVNADD